MEKLEFVLAVLHIYLVVVLYKRKRRHGLAQRQKDPGCSNDPLRQAWAGIKRRTFQLKRKVVNYGMSVSTRQYLWPESTTVANRHEYKIMAVTKCCCNLIYRFAIDSVWSHLLLLNTDKTCWSLTIKTYRKPIASSLWAFLWQTRITSQATIETANSRPTKNSLSLLIL